MTYDPDAYLEDPDEEPECALCGDVLPSRPVQWMGRGYCSSECAVSDALSRLTFGTQRYAVRLRRHRTERMAV